MKVTLVNEQTGISITFLNAGEIVRMFGYEYTLHDKIKYIELTNQELIFNGEEFSGFYDNRSPLNYTTEALATNGQKWWGRRLQANTISWTFFPQLLEYNSPYGISPHAILNAFVEAESEIKVIVQTGTTSIFTSYYFFTDGTNTESGIIEMQTSRDDLGIMWRTNDVDLKYIISEMGGTAKLPLTMPQVHLDKTGIEALPLKLKLLSTTEVRPVITFGHSQGMGGDFTEVTFTNTTSGESFTFKNVNGHKVIKVDSENQTVTTSNGADEFVNFSGDWITLLGAINNCTFDVTFADEQYYPEDFYVRIQYANYQSSITN